jgi:hypothetical protein
MYLNVKIKYIYNKWSRFLIHNEDLFIFNNKKNVMDELITNLLVVYLIILR